MPSTTVVNTPKLRRKQVITLDAGRHSKVLGYFDHDQDGQWWIELSNHEFSTMRIFENVSLHFAIDGYIYHANTKIAGVHENQKMLVISKPVLFETRPIRNHQRIRTRLEAALILKETEYTSGSFVYRNENRILNISVGGTQLACSDPLPEGVTNLLLLLGLNTDNPYAKESQICCHGTITRVANETSDDQFPYIYGIRFKPMAPIFEKMLEEFINLYSIVSGTEDFYQIEKTA